MTEVRVDSISIRISFGVSFVYMTNGDSVHLGPSVLKVRTEKGVESSEAVENGFFNRRGGLVRAKGKSNHDLGGTVRVVRAFETLR
jgi:hypothetical protein